METGASFREVRWARFELALAAWLETPEGRFAEFCARREPRTRSVERSCGA